MRTSLRCGWLVSACAIVLCATTGLAGAASIAYRYDARDRLIRTEYPGGTVVRYRYDGAGNLVAMHVDPDTDRDGVTDSRDAFPENPAEAIDTDGDGTGDNADRDDDDDGLSDESELAAGTDPVVPDIRLSLRPGLNLVALPIAVSPPLDAEQLLGLLGASRISRYDPLDGRLETVEQGGAAGHVAFPIRAHEGYEVVMNAPGELLLEGEPAPAGPLLHPGPNLIAAAGASAFGILERLGGAEHVAALSRFDPATGRFETAAFAGERPVGTDFALARGAAYWLWLR